MRAVDLRDNARDIMTDTEPGVLIIYTAGVIARMEDDGEYVDAAAIRELLARYRAQVAES